MLLTKIFHLVGIVLHNRLIHVIFAVSILYLLMAFSDHQALTEVSRFLWRPDAFGSSTQN